MNLEIRQSSVFKEIELFNDFMPNLLLYASRLQIFR